MTSPPLSRLGFGTSGLMGSALTTSGRLRLLQVAFDHGITHFDTAPLYGMGLAEEVLGRFAREHRDAITITTKFGLDPRPIPAPVRPFLPIARLIRRQLVRRRSLPPASAEAPGQATPSVTPRPSAPAATPSPPPPVPYTEASIRAHLEESLRKLSCDHIDFYLLHDCHPAYVSDEVMELLEVLVQEGKIRRYGIGTYRHAARRILEERPDFRGVVQIPSHLLQADSGWFVRHAPPPLFSHSALRPLEDPGEAGTAVGRAIVRWADLTGEDPGDPALPGQLFLLGALHRNPHGCVVFSSRTAARVITNAGLLARLERCGPALDRLLAAEDSGAAVS